MNLAEWLKYIEGIHTLGWDLGLDRVGEVGRRLDVLKPAKTVFLVAGTNGKGSACEVLAQLCTQSNLSYGKTTSPFLISYNEQFVVNGKLMSDEYIIEAFEKIEEARKEISLTYFEFSALAAMLIFKGQQVDVAIFEVGLGGRLDAMNIVDADISIITKIAIDHTDWLGSDRETIAKEKAGVYRSGCPAIIADIDPPNSLIQEADLQGAQLQLVGKDYVLEDGLLTLGSQTFDLNKCLLPQESAAAAIVAFRAANFQIKEEDIQRAVSLSKLPGRYQRIKMTGKQGQDLLFILDVAHNPNAAEYLLDKLDQNGIGKVAALVSMYADKDIDQVFKILAPVIATWHFPNISHPRSASAVKLSNHLSISCGLAGMTYDKVKQAIEAATSNSDIVLVFGSFSIVAAAIEYIETEKATIIEE